jgi:integrase
MRTILLALHREGGGAWTPSARHVADALVAMAQRWARLPEAEVQDLARLRSMVRLDYQGLSPRAEDRLAQLGDERAVAALFSLPERAFAQAEALLREGQALKAGRLHETALCLALLLARPLRIGDLAGLDLQRDARRDRAGRLIEFAVLIQKTRGLQRITLDDDLRRRIERHISTFRPLLEGAANGHALFPAKDGTPRRASILGRHLTRLVARQVGVVFRPHDARHLAAELLLDADPNALPVAQQLLGRATPKVTEQTYATRKGRAAQAEYLRLVGEVRERGTGCSRS